MRRILFIMLGMLLISAQLLAQNRTITGRITDDKGNPIPNASVIIKGTTNGTTTDNAGSFSLTVPSGARSLLVSSVGMGQKEISLTSSNVYDVSLSAAANSMEEVVVVGYQTRRKLDEAGAISSVRGAEIENKPNVSIDKALQGKAAGVVVQSNNGIPGGAITVRNRGYGSINAGNTPLYVVDGVQLNTSVTTTFTQSNPLAFLNPDDIESIDILKDAATAAIYGAAASNGVVVITTKKGRAGKTKFQLNTYYGMSSPLKKLDVLNSQEYFQLRTESVGNANNLPASDIAVKRNVLINDYRFASALINSLSDKQLDSLVAAVPTIDWQDAAFRNGSVRNFELSASGGNDRTTFRISGNYNQQAAIVTRADFSRAGLNMNLSNKATDKLTISTGLNLSTFNQKTPFSTGGSSLGNIAFSAGGILPFNPIYNPDGSYYGMPGQNPSNLSGVLSQNAVAVNDLDKGDQRSNQLVGNIQGEYRFFDWLSFRSFYSLDFRNVEGMQWWDPRTPDAFSRKGLLQVLSTWNTNFLTSQVFNANFTVADRHRIDGLVGYEYRRENNRQIYASGENFPTPEFRTLRSSAANYTVDETKSGFRRQGVFASMNFSGFDGRYIVGLVGRYDGSSRFGANNKYGFFPGLKLAWNIDRENFLKGVTAISALRLRFGIGKTGNDQIANFASRGLYSGGSVYNAQAGISYSQLANPDLTWEENVTKNIGTDFGFFQNRLNGTIEVYDKRTNELLLDQTVAWTSGFGGITSNVGRVQNRGIELTLNGTILRGRTADDFSWNTNFVLGYNKSKLLELFGSTKNIGTAYVVGQPLFLIQAAPYAGVNAATGRPMWYDSLGNLTYLVQTRDNRIIGDELPEYTGGLTNTFSYKGFSLEVFFQYEYGRLVNDGQVSFMSEATGRINWLQSIYDNRWTTPGQVTSVPRMHLSSSELKGSGPQSGSRMWVKGDYVRLKNIMLSYDVPSSVVRRLKISGAKFYVQGSNLYTFADSPSYDPEFLGAGTGQIPQSKNVTVGLQIGF